MADRLEDPSFHIICTECLGGAWTLRIGTNLSANTAELLQLIPKEGIVIRCEKCNKEIRLMPPQPTKRAKGG